MNRLQILYLRRLHGLTGNRIRQIMATDDFPEYKTVSVADLIPYARNSRPKPRRRRWPP